MHVLTKIFVVIAAVLSIALSALVIAYAVNTDRVATDYTAVQAKLTAAEAQARAQIAAASEEQARLSRTVDQLNTELATRTAEIQRLQSEKATLVADRDRAEAARQGVESKIAELGETAKTQAELIRSYRDEVTTLRGNELQYRTRALEMDDRLSDLESQREVLEQNYRALQEELAELRRDRDAALAGTTGAGSNQPFVYSGPLINGRVENVSVDPASKRTLAQINVGTNDRVQENMTFYIVRNNEFLGNLVVTTTDLRTAVGVVNTLNMQGVEIKPGDLVLSRLR